MLVYFLVLCLIQRCVARVYYVDSATKFPTNGRTGTLLKPFLRIQDCVNAITKAGKESKCTFPFKYRNTWYDRCTKTGYHKEWCSQDKIYRGRWEICKNSGDECQIRAGRYHEVVSVTGLWGTPDKPIIIKGYKDERPLIDGTVEIETTTAWTNDASGSIYRAKITRDIWQLFVNGKMMTNARWPNAKWSDHSVFNGTLWSKLASSSERGFIVNKGNSLKNTSLNMNGAMAILNIGSFNTFVAKVENHEAGSNNFTFEDTFGDYHFSAEKSRYYLEDKLNLLDTSEEWFYDKDNKTLHIWTPTGGNPKDISLRGKVQSYAFNITNSSHVIIQNLDFFATTLCAESSNSSYNVNNITFHSLNFKFHSYSKRMLGVIGLINSTDVNGIYDRRRKSINTWGTFKFFNNTFHGSDGLALSYHGANVTLENNLFEYNDFTASNMIVANGGVGTIQSDSINDLFLRNTLRYNGASAGIRPGRKPRVILNDISYQCWGIIQNDGAGVQVTSKPQDGCLLENNWVHDQPKYGLRFDGQPPIIGRNGTMSHNVVGRCNGMMIKGDYQTATNNLAFEKMNGNDDDKQGAGCALCSLRYVRKNPIPINNHTALTNNVADVANGGRIIGGKGKVYPVAGLKIENNVFGKKVTQVLMDPHNFDYRPRKNSAVAKQKAGPYPYMEEISKYWIPGRQLYKATTPIPPDQSNNVKAIRRDALMFLKAHGCNTHNLYFGTDKTKVETADEDSPEFHKRISDGNNVVYLETKVLRHKEYYWRVDALMNDAGNGIVYKGDVWSFKTI